jgi:hypothetical protein
MSIMVGSNHSNIAKNHQHACHNRWFTFVVKNRLEHIKGKCNTCFRAYSGMTPCAISRGSLASLFHMNSNLFHGMFPSTCSTRATPWLSVYLKPYIPYKRKTYRYHDLGCFISDNIGFRILSSPSQDQG